MVRTVYRAECSSMPVVIHGEEVFCITIAGQSFCYNQIRNMVGVALLSSWGYVAPDFSMAGSFLAAGATKMPLPPGSTLVLEECSFRPSSNLLLHKDAEREVFGTLRSKDSVTLAGVEAPLCLLSDRQFARAQAFKRDVILPSLMNQKNIEEWASWKEIALESGPLSLLKSRPGERESKFRGTRRSSSGNLPQGLPSVIAAQYGVRPGLLVQNAVDALEKCGKEFESHDDALRWIEDKGGLDSFAY